RWVRVVHGEPGVGELQGGAIELLDVTGREDHRQIAVTLQEPVLTLIRQRDESEVVGVLETPHPGDLDGEGELFLARLLVAELDDHVQRIRSDREYLHLSHRSEPSGRSRVFQTTTRRSMRGPCAYHDDRFDQSPPGHSGPQPQLEG